MIHDRRHHVCSTLKKFFCVLLFGYESFSMSHIWMVIGILSLNRLSLEKTIFAWFGMQVLIQIHMQLQNNKTSFSLLTFISHSWSKIDTHESLLDLYVLLLNRFGSLRESQNSVHVIWITCKRNVRSWFSINE